PRGEKNCSSFFFADEPRASRMLVMKAPPQDVANLAFHHSWRSAGSHLSFSSCWTRNTSTAIHRDFSRSLRIFPTLILKCILKDKYFNTFAFTLTKILMSQPLLFCLANQSRQVSPACTYLTRCLRFCLFTKS